jgi:hypothetical protein
MAARRQWSDLSQRTRRLLIGAGVAEGMLKVAALIDLKRRPATQVRGPKWLWATVMALVGSAGIVPISYFAFGRRQPSTGRGTGERGRQHEQAEGQAEQA